MADFPAVDHVREASEELSHSYSPELTTDRREAAVERAKVHALLAIANKLDLILYKIGQT